VHLVDFLEILNEFVSNAVHDLHVVFEVFFSFGMARHYGRDLEGFLVKITLIENRTLNEILELC
jgi:hypothetical protein